MIDAKALRLAQEIVERAISQGMFIATAESCTGGLVGAALTAISGSSQAFDRGFITYSNEAKAEMLGVPTGLIAQFGAVSENVARAMAEGALLHSRATLTVSVTGIAGPGGGSAEKPVGLVHFASAKRSGVTTHQVKQFGNLGRHEVRLAALHQALTMLLQGLSA